MKKAEISVKVGKESKTIPAYLSETVGLAVHRDVTYSPSGDEYKLGSNWQISHVATGLRITPPAGFKTKKIASEVARRLDGVVDWTSESPAPDPEENRRVIKERDRVIRDVIDGKPAKDEEAKPPTTIRYVVRRNDHGPGYVIFDTVEGAVHAETMHRGIASEKAKALNKKVA